MESMEQWERDALKAAYPNLKDADIDEYERLLGERFLVDPAKDPDRIKQLDAARIDLVTRLMPDLTNVLTRARKTR